MSLLQLIYRENTHQLKSLIIVYPCHIVNVLVYFFIPYKYHILRIAKIERKT